MHETYCTKVDKYSNAHAWTSMHEGGYTKLNVSPILGITSKDRVTRC